MKDGRENFELWCDEAPVQVSGGVSGRVGGVRGWGVTASSQENLQCCEGELLLLVTSFAEEL